MIILQQQQHLVPPALPPYFYDPTVEVRIQDEAWTCSVYAGDWCLRSLGLPSDNESLEREMLDAGVVTKEYGLMDARGYGLASILEKHLPEGAKPPVVEENATWAWLAKRAGYGPIAIGGRNWYHWVAVRDYIQGRFMLANSAPGYRGVQQYLTLDDFARLGTFSAVWIPDE